MKKQKTKDSVSYRNRCWTTLVPLHYNTVLLTHKYVPSLNWNYPWEAEYKYTSFMTYLFINNNRCFILYLCILLYIFSLPALLWYLYCNKTLLYVFLFAFFIVNLLWWVPKGQLAEFCKCGLVIPVIEI